MIEGSAPKVGTLEFSVFGTGFGESACVYLGNGDWMVVDSCTPARNAKPLALAYLEGIGVDCATAVKVVALSHWDGDHIEGAATIYDACENAQLAFSNAFTTQEFSQLMGSYGNPVLASDAETSKLKEFGRLIETRKRRKITGGPAPLHVTEGLTLYSKAGVHVRALAPSPRTIEQSIETLAQWLGDGQKGLIRRPIAQHRNDFTLVLWVDVEDRCALLGGDLEVTGDALTGWQAAANSALVGITSRAGFYKVAHHGSPNGDHSDIWAKLVKEGDAVCAVTAFNRGKRKRPDDDDVARLLSRSNRLYATTLPSPQPKARQPVVDKVMGEVTVRRTALVRAPGQIRVRWPSGQLPSVEVAGSASLLRP